jgi:hypothetical protein
MLEFHKKHGNIIHIVQDEITLISVNRLAYMLECLDEALRMDPSIANGFPGLPRKWEPKY